MGLIVHQHNGLFAGGFAIGHEHRAKLPVWPKN
jgi:hypothetical protein